MTRYVLVAALSVLTLSNGVVMVLAPESWYWAVPGVPDRGPFNQHFVRDIGILYVLIGCGFAAGLRYAGQRLVLWLLPTLWLAGHAMFHLWEVWVGICGPESLAEDFLGVTLPALLGGWLVWTARRRHAPAG